MRKILIIATATLIFVMTLLFVFNSLRRQAPSPEETTTIAPTTVPFETFSRDDIIGAGQSLAPYETNNFRFDYSPEQDRMVVTEKTETGRQEYVNWVTDNGLNELVGNPELVVFEKGPSSLPSTGVSTPEATGAESPGVNQSTAPDLDPLIDFANIFLNFGQEFSSGQSGSLSPTPSFGSEGEEEGVGRTPSGLVYYAQCNGYGGISLPSGCNLCQSGCGPTTVAMIAASYLGSQYNPQRIVNLYQERGYFLGCGGSYFADAKAALEGLGLKTTSYMSYNLATANEVAADFKKYIDAGWTIFTLANFRSDGGGHYFWVTDVRGGNIYAYDPYYGKSSPPPINENDRYPFPKYRIAFGVKR